MFNSLKKTLATLSSMTALTITTLALSWLLPNLAIATTIEQDLTRFFDTLATAHHSSPPTAVLGQQAGFYTGGSLFTRNTIRDIKPVNVTVPKINAGCGGIDLYMGSFSHINTEEFVNLIKSIMANSTGYAFSLALKTVTSQIESLTGDLSKKMDEWTRFNINSCEVATQMVGGLWPESQISSKQICQDIGTQGDSGLFGDAFNARRHCSAAKDFDKALNKAKKQNAYSDRLPSVNFAWKALQENDFFAKNPKLSEFIMSLSGTLILPELSTTNQNKQKPHVLPTLAHHDSVVSALLKGGRAKIYQCDELKQCLNPSTHTVNIDSTHALKPRVTQLLQSMVHKIQQDQAMSADEMALLQNTQLPLYKMLNVQSAFHQGQAALALDSYSETIALDMLYHYLQQAIHDIQSHASGYSYPKNQQVAFIKSLDTALYALYQKQQSAYSKLSHIEQMTAQNQTLERMLVGQMASQL